MLKRISHSLTSVVFGSLLLVLTSSSCTHLANDPYARNDLKDPSFESTEDKLSLWQPMTSLIEDLSAAEQINDINENRYLFSKMSEGALEAEFVGSTPNYTSAVPYKILK
jgi:hypothetical protein